MQKTFNIVEISHFNMRTGWFVAQTDDGEKVVGESIIPPYGIVHINAERTSGKYGPQWKVKGPIFQDVEQITLSLLSSGVVAEIRESKAQEIFNKFGSHIWGILDACVKVEMVEWNGKQWDPSKLLMTTKGVKKVVSKQMIDSWRENRQNFVTAINAMKCGMTPRQYRKVMISSIEVGKFDMMLHNIEPFSCYDLHEYGLSFEDCDRIALEDWPDKPALEQMSHIRLAGAVKKVIGDICSEGHMCAPKDHVEEQVHSLIGIPTVFEYIGDLRKVRLVEYGDDIYRMNDYYVEVETMQHLKEIMRTPGRTFDLSPQEIQSYADFELSDEQVAAIQMILTNKVSILTGGPGTGKTSILKVAVSILDHRQVSVTQAAFMGATARRMEKATGYPASTLHSRFLLFKDPDDRDRLMEGYLFIDEVSTMSADLFRDTIKQVDPRVRLVLIGDADQLPPVGNGEVFLQLINSGVIPTARLTKIFRNGGAIALGCYEVNHGRMPSPDNQDFYLIRTTDLVGRMEKAHEWLVGQKGIESVMVLTPLNAVRQKINHRMQELLNPGGYSVPMTKIGDTSIRVGDPVVQLVNNGKLGVMNGMTGTCMGLSDKALNVSVGELFKPETETEIAGILFDGEKDQIWHTDVTIPQLDLAYAITVHKSIGNQFDGVIVVLPFLPEVMQLRQIVYTAMSRAKKKLIVLTAPGTIEKCIQNEERIRRVSHLGDFMKEA